MKIILIGNFEEINIFLSKYKKVSVIDFINQNKNLKQSNIKIYCNGGKYEK